MTLPDLLWPTYLGPADLGRIEGVPLSGRGLPASTYAALDRAATLWPDRPAVSVLSNPHDPRETVTCTFAGLRDDVHKIANLFHARGVRRSSAVAILAPNTHLTPALLLAAQSAGVALPLHPRLAAPEIARLLTQTGARVLVAAGPELDPGTWHTAHALAGRLNLDALYSLRPAGSVHRAPALEPIPGREVAHLTCVVRTMSRTLAPVPPRPDDLAALFPTGHRPGSPKVAAHTHSNQITNAWSTAADSNLDGESVLFAGLPLFQPDALMITLLGPLLRGQHVLWAGPRGFRDPALYVNFWKIIQRHRIAALLATPATYSSLGQLPLDADVSSLRIAAVAGAAGPPGAVRAAFTARTGVDPCEGYGLAEATSVIARNFTGRNRHPLAVGQRLPYQQAKTIRVDQAGTWHDLPDHTPGILAIRGPSVFPGYVTGADGDGPRLDSLGKLRDGWLNTGDLARIDPGGFIHLANR
ncbi:AMP-binding protein [Streptomyces sp. NPDC054855]